jgi:ribosomal protein S18 acetylase RimI-like enzyme
VKHAIRTGTSADIPILEAIDDAAGELFPRDRLPDAEEPFPFDDYARSAQEGLLFVAEVGGEIAGYAMCSRYLDLLHLQQISVHPDHGRRGIGRALVERVLEEAGARALSAVTLTTFDDLPWNGPFYRSLGFRTITATARYPEVQEALDRERGLGMYARVGMIREARSSA